MQQQPILCQVCAKPADLKCSACRSISYCSSQHQHLDWKRHEKECPPFLITEDPIFGKQWVAARNLKAGKILLQETPVLTAAPYDNSTLSALAFAPCTTCASISRRGQTKLRCSKCTWPVCSSRCEDEPVHAANECKLFMSKQITFPPPKRFDNASFGDLVMLIRAAGLKKQQPDAYEKLLELQSEESLPPSELCQNFKDRILSLFRSIVDEDDDVWIEEEERYQLVQAIVLNRVSQEREEDRQPAAFQGGPLPKISVLAVNFSRLNNSCAPNCSWEVGNSHPFKINVQTSIPVQRNDQLTICYNNALCCSETRVRQQLFQQSLGSFICRCDRCKDPTELGTFMSAVTCKRCNAGSNNRDNHGYLLPQNPFDITDNVEWKCNRCGFTQRVKEFCHKIKALGDLIAERDHPVSRSSTQIDYGLIEMCENIIRHNKYLVLHPNHWVMQRASEAITFHSGATREKQRLLDKRSADRFLQHSLFLLGIQDKIMPGINKNRVSLQINISRVILLLFQKFKEDMDWADVAENLRLCIQMQEESLQFYTHGYSRSSEQSRLRANEIRAGLRESRLALDMVDQVRQMADAQRRPRRH